MKSEHSFFDIDEFQLHVYDVHVVLVDFLLMLQDFLTSAEFAIL